MEPVLIISNLNDFIFCPRSIYFHNLYGRVDSRVYYETPQVAGKIAHETIENHSYSTSKKIITGLEVYSERFQLGGKIDILDTEKGLLIERKRKIKTIYDGYRFQLYAQYLCLTEMGYSVQSLAFHSIVDNRRYPIQIPTGLQWKPFLRTIKDFKNFNLNTGFTQNPKKCQNCIYYELCDTAAEMIG